MVSDVPVLNRHHAVSNHSAGSVVAMLKLIETTQHALYLPTHWGRVTHIFVIELGHLLIRLWLVYCSVPSNCLHNCQLDPVEHTLLAKKVVTPPLKTIKPMWIELLCFHLSEIGMIWTRDCSPTKSDTTLGRHSMQGQVGSSSSETTV